MAFTKKEKTERLATYVKWLEKSQAFFMMDFKKMTMKDIDGLRAKVRDAGGEVHVVKNTLMTIALKNAGIEKGGDLEGTSLVGFAFSDAPALAKVFNEASRNSEIYKIKGGYLTGQPISQAEVKSLAELPPLPMMRAILLGVLAAPASRLVRTLAEPARQVASVLKSYSEKEAAPAA